MPNSMTINRTCCVYWLYNEQCVCCWRHGYIGITAVWPKRLKQHRYNKRFPKDFQWKILFIGTEEECFSLEMQMRPDHGIGWNLAKGGNNTGRTLGYKHSEQSRANVGSALKGRVITKEWREKLAKASTGQKRTAESRAKQSAKMKGKPKSAEWRAMMSEKTKARYINDPTASIKTSIAVKRGLRTRRAAFAPPQHNVLSSER